MKDKKIYTFEVYGIKNKRLGSTGDECLTKSEMILKAQGMLQGASMFRSQVSVKVREKGNNEYCFELKS